MSLKQRLNANIARAFDGSLSDAVREFVGQRHSQSIDDWLDNAGTQSKTEYHGRGVFSRYKGADIDGALILATDKQLLCLQSEVSQSPKVGDTIAGYRVIAVSQDPTQVTYSLQLRKV